MNESKYVVDNNALIAIKGSRIRSDFFRENCRLTADVLFEAGAHPDMELLEACTDPIEAGTLQQLRRVMASISVGDTSLIDLYQNTGAADPGLVAYVLETIARDEGTFFADEWSIVTQDRAVLRKAAEFGIPTVSPDELAALIDRG